MSETLMVEKDKVLAAAEKCGDAKDVLMILFPDIFKPQTRDITGEINFRAERAEPAGWYLQMFHLGNLIGNFWTGDAPFFGSFDTSEMDGLEYRIEKKGNYFRIFKRV